MPSPVRSLALHVRLTAAGSAGSLAESSRARFVPAGASRGQAAGRPPPILRSPPGRARQRCAGGGIPGGRCAEAARPCRLLAGLSVGSAGPVRLCATHASAAAPSRRPRCAGALPLPTGPPASRPAAALAGALQEPAEQRLPSRRSLYVLRADAGPGTQAAKRLGSLQPRSQGRPAQTSASKYVPQFRCEPCGTTCPMARATVAQCNARTTSCAAYSPPAPGHVLLSITRKLPIPVRFPM